jgi:hypothetical protein
MRYGDSCTTPSIMVGVAAPPVAGCTATRILKTYPMMPLSELRIVIPGSSLIDLSAYSACTCTRCRRTAKQRSGHVRPRHTTQCAGGSGAWEQPQEPN